MTTTLTKPRRLNSSTSLRRLSLTAGLSGLLTVPGTFWFTDQRATYLPARELLLRGSLHVAGVTGHVASEFHQGMSDRFPLNIAALLPFAWMTPRWAIAFAALPWVMLTVYLLGRFYGHRVALTAVCCTPLVYVGREFWPQTIAIPLLLLLENTRRNHWASIVGLALLRPPIAILGACLSIIQRRRMGVAVASLAFSAVALLLYTRYFFGHWGMAGGYSTEQRTPVLHALYVGLLSPQRGILFYCPWLLFIRRPYVWQSIWKDRFPPSLIITGLYTLGEWFTYDAWGGNGYLGFRYALPFVILAIPYVQAPSWLFGWSAGISIYLLLFDDYAFSNVERHANVLPHPAAFLLSGISGVILMAKKWNK